MITIDSTPEFASSVYERMDRTLAAVRKNLNRPLGLADKVLLSHLDDPSNFHRHFAHVLIEDELDLVFRVLRQGAPSLHQRSADAKVQHLQGLRGHHRAWHRPDDPRVGRRRARLLLGARPPGAQIYLKNQVLPPLVQGCDQGPVRATGDRRRPPEDLLPVEIPRKFGR